jgi:hypothetical protein
VYPHSSQTDESSTTKIGTGHLGPNLIPLCRIWFRSVVGGRSCKTPFHVDIGFVFFSRAFFDRATDQIGVAALKPYYIFTSALANVNYSLHNSLLVSLLQVRYLRKYCTYVCTQDFSIDIVEDVHGSLYEWRTGHRSPDIRSLTGDYHRAIPCYYRLKRTVGCIEVPSGPGPVEASNSCGD